MTQSIVDAIKALPPRPDKPPTEKQSIGYLGDWLDYWKLSFLAERARLSLLMRAVGEWNDARHSTTAPFRELAVAESNLRAVYEALK